MILPIVQSGNAVLRQPARPLTREEILSPRIAELIENMKETMHAAPGVGLAAPQVGESIQLAVIEDGERTLGSYSDGQLAERERFPVPFHVVINPAITLLDSDPRVEFFEGCLSLAGLVAIVPRARKVRVECLNERAEPRVFEAGGWYARILQHEIDHLRGALYVDRMHSRSLMTVEQFNQHWKEKQVEEVKAGLGISRSG